MKYLFGGLAALEGRHITGERHLGADGAESCHRAINCREISSPSPPPTPSRIIASIKRVKHPGMAQSCGQAGRNAVSEPGWRKGNDNLA